MPGRRWYEHPECRDQRVGRAETPDIDDGTERHPTAVGGDSHVFTDAGVATALSQPKPVPDTTARTAKTVSATTAGWNQRLTTTAIPAPWPAHRESREWQGNQSMEATDAPSVMSKIPRYGCLRTTNAEARGR